MALKQLRGIAHDLAHHSQSGLSWVHPHMAEACQDAGVHEVTFDLLAPELYPCDLASRKPLWLALTGLQTWFLDLLVRQGHDRASITHAILKFQFRDSSSSYDSAVWVTITTSTGKEYSGHVDFICGPTVD